MDGRNGSGDFVLNGAYLVTISASTGEVAKLKVAVIK